MTSASDLDLLGTPDAGPAAIRGGFLRVVGYGVGVLLAVGSAAVLFRHLGIDDTGRYVLVLSLVTLFGGITDAGLSTIGVRELAARGGMERGLLLRTLLGLRITFTLAGALLACGYAALAGFDRVLILGTAIASLGLLLTTVQAALSTVLIADLRLGWVTLADGLRQVVTALGIVVLVVAGAELLSFIAISVLAAGLSLGLTAWLVRNVPWRPSYSTEAWRDLLRHTLPFALASAVGAIYFRLAILMVEALAGSEQTGFFGASFRIVEVLVIVPQLAIGAAFPIFARAASDDLARWRYAVQRTFEASLVLGVGVALGLGVGAPVAIEVVAGAEFGPAAPVLRLHAVALLASFVAAVFGYALLSLRQHGAVLTMNAAALVTIAVAGGVLIGPYGARGGAAATALSEAVLGLVGAIALVRSGAVGRGVSLGVVPRVALAAGPAIILPVVLGLPSLPATLLALALFALGVMLVGAVPEEILVEARAARVRMRASRAEGRRT